MGLFDFISAKDADSNKKAMSAMEKLGTLRASDVLATILKETSGVSQHRKLKYELFYNIYGFRGTCDGVGTSTIVANTALALASLELNVLVVDTSILLPHQDILLKTNYTDGSVEDKNKLDWFDMLYTKNSVLHPSKLNKRISVLSFYGKKRNIVDLLSNNDSQQLVDIAIDEFRKQFDIILIDLCHETTSIVLSSIHNSQQIFQVWNDTPWVIGSLESEIDTLVTLACPMDKMRNVIYSRICRESIGNCDTLLKQYRLNKVTEIPMSQDIYLTSCTESSIWDSATMSKDVTCFNSAIIDIVKLMVKDEDENGPHGTITSNDIMAGRVEGTATRKMRKKMRNVAVTEDEINKQLENGGTVDLDPNFENDKIENPFGHKDDD